jgi:hypothetical protein
VALVEAAVAQVADVVLLRRATNLEAIRSNASAKAIKIS